MLILGVRWHRYQAALAIVVVAELVVVVEIKEVVVFLGVAAAAEHIELAVEAGRKEKVVVVEFLGVVEIAVSIVQSFVLTVPFLFLFAAAFRTPTHPRS